MPWDHLCDAIHPQTAPHRSSCPGKEYVDHRTPARECAIPCEEARPIPATKGPSDARSAVWPADHHPFQHRAPTPAGESQRPGDRIAPALDEYERTLHGFVPRCSFAAHAKDAGKEAEQNRLESQGREGHPGDNKTHRPRIIQSTKTRVPPLDDRDG